LEGLENNFRASFHINDNPTKSKAIRHQQSSSPKPTLLCPIFFGNGLPYSLIRLSYLSGLEMEEEEFRLNGKAA
jgi:hypothetical protein